MLWMGLEGEGFRGSFDPCLVAVTRKIFARRVRASRELLARTGAIVSQELAGGIVRRVSVMGGFGG